MPTITTAVRDLKPGDVVFDPLPGPVGGATSYAVLDLAIADPGPVGLQLARLGAIPAHLDRVATVSWPAEALLEVRRRAPEAGRFDRVTRQPDGSFVHSYRGEPVAGPSATGVPALVHRALVGQAELLERHFGLDERLDVAYVADTMRVAAGERPIHEERVPAPGGAVGATDVLVALADLERAAKAGPANPNTVRALAAKIRAELLK